MYNCITNPSFPVPAFRDVVDVPLVVRRLHKQRKEVLSHEALLNLLIILSH